MVKDCPVLVDYSIVVNKSLGGEFTLGFLTMTLNEHHERLVIHLVSQLDYAKRREFLQHLEDTLRADLSANLYSLYHVGTIIE